MQIIFSSYDDLGNPFYGGGGARAIHEISKRLATTHQVTVLTANYPGAENDNIEGVTYKRIGPPFLGPILGQICFQLLLPWYCHFSEFDIWIESFTPPFSTAFLPLVTRKPVIGLAQLLSGTDMSHKYHLPFFLLENLGLKFYHQCIVLTADEKRKLQRKFPQMAISVIPNGVNGWPETNTPKTQNTKALFLGRFDIHQKGLDVLIEAWSQITLPKAKLLLAGSGSPKELKQLKSMIRERNLSRRIQFCGPVHGTAKQELLKNCQIVVVPSRFESFSITALEALQAGKQVVAFAIPGLSWIPAKFIRRADAFDAQDLAVKISEALTTPSDKNLAAEAYLFSQKYTWQIIAQRFEKLICSNLTV